MTPPSEPVKACPFCGQEVRVGHFHPSEECFLSGLELDRADVKRWNRRASQGQQAAGLDVRRTIVGAITAHGNTREPWAVMRLTLADAICKALKEPA